VARQTRAQRRARRQQETKAEPALAGAGGRGTKPPVRLAPEPPARPERGRRAREHAGGFGRGFGRFVVESWGELRKVEWPSQSHVLQGTVVVLMACLILGTFIWVADIAFKHVVQDLLLR
jgi:preprotein translocase subunit SecE